MTTARLAEICRYPVKGLSPQRLEKVRVDVGQTLPFDRAWAIENGKSNFDPAAPKHLPKIAYLMLMRNERLASLATEFDEAGRILTIRRNGEALARGSLESEAGRIALAAFFNRFAASELRGPARIVSAPGHAFTDTATKCVSLINRATVQDIEMRIGAPVHPLRFRGNLYVDGLPAWAEFGWIGKRVAAGGVILEAYKRIERCAATNVNPDTAERDLAIPRSLLECYGHSDCGIYLKVVEGGELRTGDTLAPQ
ncbi:MOSC domain-containing protein [soil metagenome]